MDEKEQILRENLEEYFDLAESYTKKMNLEAVEVLKEDAQRIKEMVK